jgi:hypothetical protein
MQMEWVHVPINDTYLLFTLGPKGMNLFANRSKRNVHVTVEFGGVVVVKEFLFFMLLVGLR